MNCSSYFSIGNDTTFGVGVIHMNDEVSLTVQNAPSIAQEKKVL